MDKKQAALEATLKLIAEQGFHGTPMSQIAQRANIGVGTIYRYFSGKEELINELYIYIKKQMTDEILKNYNDKAPIKENFMEILKDTICYMTAHSAELSFHEQYWNSPLITQDTKEQGILMMGSIQSLFQRARSEGMIKELSDDILLTLVSGTVFALAKLHISTGLPVQDDSLIAETEAIWDMIKNKGEQTCNSGK